MTPLDVDQTFFGALVAADTERLAALLAPDFVLVDVMGASVIARAALLEVVGSGQLVFDEIRSVEDALVRSYPSTTVIVGQTTMSGRFGPDAFAARSRYTHVFVEGEQGWLLASAQGTQIPDAA